MAPEQQQVIRNQLNNYFLSYQNDGNPISVNFRTLVPELKKSERNTHLIHSYPAELITKAKTIYGFLGLIC